MFDFTFKMITDLLCSLFLSKINVKVRKLLACTTLVHLTEMIPAVTVEYIDSTTARSGHRKLFLTYIQNRLKEIGYTPNEPVFKIAFSTLPTYDAKQAQYFGIYVIVDGVLIDTEVIACVYGDSETELVLREQLRSIQTFNSLQRYGNYEYTLE